MFCPFISGDFFLQSAVQAMPVKIGFKHGKAFASTEVNGHIRCTVSVAMVAKTKLC